jgi:hypothetical protein
MADNGYRLQLPGRADRPVLVAALTDVVTRFVELRAAYSIGPAGWQRRTWTRIPTPWIEHRVTDDGQGSGAELTVDRPPLLRVVAAAGGTAARLEAHPLLDARIDIGGVVVPAMQEAYAQAMLARPAWFVATGGGIDSDAGPLSPGQESLWLASQLAGDGAPYHLAVGFDILGPLDVDRLRHALELLVDGHESLRTRIVAGIGSQPEQVVRGRAPEQVTLLELPAQVPPERLALVVGAAGSRPFDLAAEPPFRATLVRAASDRHALVLASHHTAVDGWSMDLLVRQLSTVYEHGPAAAPATALRYLDYARWQRAWLETRQSAAVLARWTSSLAGCPPMLDLSTRRPSGRPPGWDGDELTAAVPTDACRGLDRLAGTGVTPFVAGLAAFAALLYRYSGQTRIVVGTPLAGRPFSELEDVVGHFVNSVPVVIEPSGEQTISELVHHVRERVLRVLSDQTVPLPSLVRRLAPPRLPGRTPVFQAFFHYQPDPFPVPTLGRARVSYRSVDTPTAQFDLMVKLTGLDGYLATLRYRTDLFDPSWAGRFLDTYLRVLIAVTADPSRRLRHLSTMRPSEQRALLAGHSHLRARL